MQYRLACVKKEESSCRLNHSRLLLKLTDFRYKRR